MTFGFSCKKFVQISSPATQLVSQSVFTNSATATAAQLNIYIQMANNAESQNISQNSGMLADELTSYSTAPSIVQLYVNDLSAANNIGSWTNGYNYIYQANAIIAGLQNNKSIILTIANQLIGESKFVRAFWLFYLTNMYGDIPLVTTTDYTVTEKLARAPKSQVYLQIVKDLNDAVQLLNSNYVDPTDTIETSDRGRPTKWAASALLARVYLYTGKYDSAKYFSTQVINNTNLYRLCKNLSAQMGASNYVFQKNSTEAIWQLSTPLPDDYNTPDAEDFILTGEPGGGQLNCSTISPELLNSFEPNDLRRTNWIGTYNTSSVTYYYPYKYQNATATVSEYVMVLRLAEQYLIRSEAEANLGDMADAANDLNIIRNRAGLGTSPILTATSTLPQADSAIMHERRIELFTEWGHRWFDLIRTAAIDSVMGGSAAVCKAKGGSWVSSDQLYPIPQTEINNDANLSQNQGY